MIALRETECCALAGTDCRLTPLRRRPSRPQLKRDPLGGALPPNKHPVVNSVGTVSTRGAERRCSRRGIGSPRPTPHGRATDRPRRAPPSMKRLPMGKFSTQRRARSPSYARRPRASVPSAPSNARLELTGALCCGRIAVVRHPTPETGGRWRARAHCARSSSAIR